MTHGVLADHVGFDEDPLELITHPAPCHGRELGRDRKDDLGNQNSPKFTEIGRKRIGSQAPQT